MTKRERIINTTKRLELIKKLTEEICNRFYDEDIKKFLGQFSIFYFGGGLLNSRDNVSKELRDSNDATLIDIAKELGIEVKTENVIIDSPKTLETIKNEKAFISHVSQHKGVANELRDELKFFNIDCFVAHEDIKPTKEWQEEIIKALQTMDFLISLHTEGFAESFWCQQEVGYAVSRGIKIIPIKFDGKQDPVGFINKIQAISWGEKTTQMIAKEIVGILKSGKNTPLNV